MTPDRGLGDDDEVVAVVADEDEARPLIQVLLLAGLGPALRPCAAGLEVTVVAGQGERAREVLAAPDAAPGPFDGVVAAGVDPSVRGPRWSSDAAGTSARTDPLHPEPPADDEAVTAGPRYGLFRVLLLFAVAMIVLPALAFYLSYKASGG